MKVPKGVKKLVRWESLLPLLLFLSPLAYWVLKNEPWDWGDFFHVITGVVAVTVTAVSFLTAASADRERRQFETDLATEMEKQRQQFEKDLAAEMAKDRQRFDEDLAAEMEKQRQQFEKDLAAEMAKDRRQFEKDLAAEMAKDRQQFEKDLEGIKQKGRREERSVEVARDEIGTITGRLHRIAERALEFPKDARFVIRVPDELRDIVTIEAEANEDNSRG